MLGESPQEALRIADRWYANTHRSRQQWDTCANASLDGALERAYSMHVPDAERLAAYLNRVSGGIVLATIHMGDYLHGLLRLLAGVQRRRLLILRRKDHSEVESAAFGKMQALGMEVDVIRHGSDAARRIVSGLRRGAVAVLLYDLPGRWGETLALNVLNQNLHWVIGPATLACLGRAQLVPLVAYRTPRHVESCLVDRIRDLSAGPHTPQTLTQVAQGLADVADRAIKARPEQWLHWHLVPEMMPETGR